MILALIVLIGLGVALLLFAGSSRAVFEIVMIWGSHDEYSKKEFENKSKDSNNDGKISWLELTFPDEPVHRVKRYEMICYGYGLTFILTGFGGLIYHFGYLNLETITALVLIIPIVFFAITGLGFDVYFKNERPK